METNYTNTQFYNQISYVIFCDFFFVFFSFEKNHTWFIYFPEGIKSDLGWGDPILEWSYVILLIQRNQNTVEMIICERARQNNL